MNALVEKLVACLPSPDAYPPGVVSPITPRLRGPSFFPGGCGFGRGIAHPLPPSPVMLVGQDFANLDYWESLVRSNKTDGEGLDGTWTGLDILQRRGCIDLAECFLTNALLGVRHGDEIEGPSPGLAHPAYVDASVDCLVRQIEIIKPRVVVALGIVPAALLASRWQRASSSAALRGSKPWNSTWRKIDAAGLQFIETCVLPQGSRFAFATAVHPCRLNNDKHRSWDDRGLQGPSAQDEIWRCVRQVQ